MRSRFVAVSVAVHAVALAAAGTLATSPRLTLPAADVLQVRLAAPQPAPAPAVTAQPPAPNAAPAKPAASPAAAAPPLPRARPPQPRPADATERAPDDLRPAKATPPTHTAAVAPADDTPPGERANHLRSTVLSLLAPTLTYPALARKYGWQGRVLVDVEMDADGSLQPLRIAHSSGYRVLDHHAFDALKRIGTVPQARPWLAGRPFAFAVPVTYRLIDG